MFYGFDYYNAISYYCVTIYILLCVIICHDKSKQKEKPQE